MDEQVQLLTSIRDILTRIERVLERVEANGAIAEAPPAATATAPVVSGGGVKPGAGKWRSR